MHYYYCHSSGNYYIDMMYNTPTTYYWLQSHTQNLFLSTYIISNTHTLMAKYLCSGGPQSPEKGELDTSTALRTDPYKHGRTVSITCHRRPLLAEASMKPPCSLDPGGATNGLGLTRWPRFHSGAGKPVAMVSVVVVVVVVVGMSDQAARTDLGDDIARFGWCCWCCWCCWWYWWWRKWGLYAGLVVVVVVAVVSAAAAAGACEKVGATSM